MLLSLSALVFSAVRKPSSIKPHNHALVKGEPVSYRKPHGPGARPIPCSRIITDWAISLGTRLAS
jgi:hypothetical protein